MPASCRSLLGVLVLLSLLIACDEDPDPVDSGTRDSGSVDAGGGDDAGADDAGNDAGGDVDAGPIDGGGLPSSIACIDGPPLTPAGASGAFAGTISQPAGTSVVGAVVDLFENSAPTTSIASNTTDGLGNYAVSFPIPAAGWDGFLRATVAGFHTLTLHRTEPFIATLPYSPQMFDDTDWAARHTALSVTPVATRGVIQLTLTDCDDNPLVGATVAVSPTDGMTQVIYTVADVPMGAVTGAGNTYITGVTSGSVTVTVTQAGRTLVDETFDLPADGWSELIGGPTRTGT